MDYTEDDALAQQFEAGYELGRDEAKREVLNLTKEQLKAVLQKWHSKEWLGAVAGAIPVTDDMPERLFQERYCAAENEGQLCCVEYETFADWLYEELQKLT